MLVSRVTNGLLNIYARHSFRVIVYNYCFLANSKSVDSILCRRWLLPSCLISCCLVDFYIFSCVRKSSGKIVVEYSYFRLWPWEEVLEILTVFCTCIRCDDD